MTRLTVVCENTAGPAYGILGEHGLSVLVERDSGCVLFDTGQGHTIQQNLTRLKKDLGRIGTIALSHGHYDHTGGLKQVLQKTGPVAVCAHSAVFTERFAAIQKEGETTYRSAGIPFARSELEGLGGRFVLNTACTEIDKGIYLSGEVPRVSAFEKDDSRLKVRSDEGYVQDSVPDDQCLVIESAQGLVVVLGCAHSGVINTLNHVTEQFPGRSVHTLIGGTHIGFLADDQIEETIQALKEFPLQKIGVSHCTGLAPAMRLMQAFGDRFFFANAGSVVDIA